jgi:hypothetical protein
VVSMDLGKEVSVFVIGFAVMEDVISISGDWFGRDLVATYALRVVRDTESCEISMRDCVHASHMTLVGGLPLAEEESASLARLRSSPVRWIKSLHMTPNPQARAKAHFLGEVFELAVRGTSSCFMKLSGP